MSNQDEHIVGTNTTDTTTTNSTDDKTEHISKPLTGRDYIRSLLSKKMVILAKDGRVLKGKFHCTDNALNIILEKCDEYQSIDQLGDSKKKRKHSILIVPERYIDQVFVIRE